MALSTALAEMENYIVQFPENMIEAIEIGTKAIKNFKTDDVDNVVIVGLGGSGIGGKIVSQLVWDKCAVPVTLVNDYRIPKWVNERTLFVATSYSGNTEETLSALGEAIQHSAQIAAITAGGKLKQLCWERSYNCIEIPGGQPPRTSFGYNSVQQFFVLQAYGLIDGYFIDELHEAAHLLKKDAGFIRTEAAAIANKIANTTPVIYSETRSEGLAVRLRQQINENAKMLCWHHSLPEMNHNELVGWAGGSNNFSALFIHTPEDHPGTATRMELSKEIIGRYTDKVIDLNPKGNSRIARAYYLIHLGDWISYYLAMERQVNPLEIEVIDYLKSELAK
ncbi:bifunctional phosphoglucose/phosphomannose isomerase [Cryomorpha ignava]|uniref:Bifunctional phosphoglucose/phosphomannose isomerase n=1 Tax=Cryomorpha ignava TaxID=101383 RepID=A0A7K3WUQ4_9FLAO|nr:bifunctional phosphoglucose/phosphomannose isomerase [Cryomorpha ignava]NEN24781.1 bifunctional phosphoglucose/phosphomannose isomerase [Cryomorpha ignava]